VQENVNIMVIKSSLVRKALKINIIKKRKIGEHPIVHIPQIVC